MNFWYRYISGYVRVSLEGIAPERFLNLCHNRGYAIWDIQYGKERNTCCMLLQDFLQIRPLARKTGTKVRVLHRYGAPFAMRRHWKRKGAILGITLFFVLLYLMSDHIWAIDVEGNHRYTEDTLLQFVTSTGISHGMKRDAISCEDLEKAIRNQYGDITWVSARIDGTRLVVQIKENDTGVSVTAKESEPADLVADFDGKIRSIVTRTGTPMVHVGDQVQKGDVLISGLLNIYDEGGGVAATHEVRADGDIVVEYRTHYERQILRSGSRRVYDREAKRWFAMFGGWRIQLLPFLPVGEREFDRVEESGQLCLLDNFYLPVYYGRVRQRFYRKESFFYTDEQLQALAEYQIYADLSQLENLGVEIIQNNVTITLRENDCICQGELVLWKSIGTYRQVSVEEHT